MRSRPSNVAVLLVPVAGIAAHFLLKDNTANAAVRSFFPVAAICLSWGFLYVRSFVDRACGFAGGLESVSSAGKVVLVSKLITCLLLALFQSAVFYAAVALGRS